LFLSCGILDGFAFILTIGWFGGSVDRMAAEAGSRLFLVISALIIILYLWGATYMGPTGKRSIIEITKGQIAPILWIGVILCGIVIPMSISIISYFVGEASALLLVTAVLCEIVGAFSLKYTILKSALYSPLIPTRS
jgi:formate-dependent nitrite reductase membrane component NrfD